MGWGGEWGTEDSLKDEWINISRCFMTWLYLIIYIFSNSICVYQMKTLDTQYTLTHTICFARLASTRCFVQRFCFPVVPIWCYEWSYILYCTTIAMYLYDNLLWFDIFSSSSSSIVYPSLTFIHCCCCWVSKIEALCCAVWVFWQFARNQ